MRRLCLLWLTIFVGGAGAGRWIVFVDADSHPSRELFADVAAVIREGRCLAGGSTVTCTNPFLTPLAPSGSSSVQIRVLPGTTAVGTVQIGEDELIGRSGSSC